MASAEGTESFAAKHKSESPAIDEQLMEEVCERENCKQALARVKANKGSPGVDGITVDDLTDYLKQYWPAIREQLLSGTYEPQPVRRVEIPKPDGGARKLGIPTVLDRFIQQAVMQVLQRRWDRTFSQHSYGFRPGRSAHQAVEQAQQYIAAGYRFVVDLDLEKFFDRVNHDRLMAMIAARVSDKRLLKLIRSFLQAGVMEDGLVSPVDEGTPQGGPITPLTQKVILIVWVVGSSVLGRNRRNRNAVTNGDGLLADQDVFNQQSHDFLPFNDTKRFRRAAQASKECGESFCQAQEYGTIIDLVSDRLQLITECLLAMT
jgi:RNA-directed DNA polymerase